MGKNKKDEWLIETKRIVVQDRAGKKWMQKMAGAGWEVVSIQKDTILRTSTVVMRKRNPDYVG
jgi:hypothetical protein